MTITTRDGLIAAQCAAQRVRMIKTSSRTSVALIPFSVFDLPGDPGAGVAAGTSTAAGVVPTDATVGCPVINAFGGSKGYISRFELSSPVACRVALYDLLWKGGAYSFNAAQTLAAQPSYSSRVPGGTDYKGTELWSECVGAFTGLQSLRIRYLDEGGAAGDTGVIATGVAPTAGRMFRMPLAAGDSGVSQITNVDGSVATVGTHNVLVMRKLAEARIRVANDQIVQGFDLVGLPEVYTDSALFLVVYADSTATSTPEAVIDIVNG